MYCPKCGGQNPDELAFCRSCGENLKIISQAMSGHAPLEIASKIDAVIGTGYERFRRDAILWLFWGVAFIVMLLGRIVWVESSQPEPEPGRASIYFIGFPSENLAVYLVALFFVSIPSLIMLGLGAWNFLLFCRARHLATNQPADKREIAGSERIFCPECGVQSNADAKTCANCSFNLELLSNEMTSDSFLTRRLDRSLERRSLRGPRARTIRWIAYGAIFWAFLAGFQFVAGNWGDGIFYSMLALTRTGVKLWDLIYFGRQHKPEHPPGAIEAFDAEPRSLPAATPWEFLEQLKKMPLAEEQELTSNHPATEFETQPLDRSQVERLVFDDSVEDADTGAATRKLSRETGE